MSATLEPATPETPFSVGDTVEALRDFSGVPKGTQGRVVELYESFDRVWQKKGIKSINIEWIGDRYRMPSGQNLRDGFSPDTFFTLAKI